MTFQETLDYINLNPNNTFDNRNYYGHLVTIESFREYKFIMDDLLVVSSGVTDVWIGAAPLDSDQNEWGWMYGTTRTQPFYSTYPERCFKFCGSFSGNLNTSRPHLYFKNVPQDYNFYDGDPNIKRFFIIEYEPIPDNIIFYNGDYMSQYLDFKYNLPMDNMTVNGFSVDYFLNGKQAKLSGDLSLYRGEFNILAYYNNTVSVNTTFQFNSPWISAINRTSNSIVSAYGDNFHQGGVDYSLVTIKVGITIISSSLNYMNQSGVESIQLVVTPPKLYPILIQSIGTSDFYIVMNRPAIYDTTSSRYYSSFPYITDYSIVKKLVQNYSLMYDTPLMALALIPEVNQFFANEFGSVSYWTNITIQNGNIFWNDQFFNSTSLAFQGDASSGIFYYNNTLNKVIGINPSVTPPPTDISLILVYGYGQPIFTYQEGITNIRGAPMSIKMISNFLRPTQQNIVTFQSLNVSTASGTGVASIQSKTIQFNIPPQFGLHVYQINITDSLVPSFVRTMNISVQYTKPPTITSISSTYFGTPDLITIIGSNFGNTGFSVQISNSTFYEDCINSNIDLRGTRIICYFSSNIVTLDSLYVNVTVDLQSVNVSKFIYNLPIVQCPFCEHGECVNSVCKCNDSYTGVSCSVQILDKVLEQVMDVPQIKNDSVEVVLGSTIKRVNFNISLTSITEVDPNNIPVKSHKFSDIKWVLESENDSIFNYTGTFDFDKDLLINVETTVFRNNTEYDFEGDVFQVLNNSVKYIIRISNWTFDSQLNSLQLDFLSKSRDTESDCNTVSSRMGNTSVNSRSSLRTMEVLHGDMILNAYFSDRMIVDGRLHYSNVSVISDKQSETGSLYVVNTFKIPYFTKSCVLDPNFSALVVFIPDKDTDSCSSSKNSWELPVIIVASVVGAAAILALIIIFIKKKYRYQWMIASVKLKNISKKG